MELFVALIYTLFTVLLINDKTNFIIIGIAVLISAILVSNKKTVFRALLLASIFSVLCFNLYDFLNIHKEFSGSEHNFNGVILEEPVIYEDYSRILVDVEIDGKSFKTQMYVDDTNINANVSDRVEGIAYFYEPKNRNGFSSVNYYNSDGIFLMSSASEIEIIKNDSFSLRKIFFDVNSYIQKTIDNSFDESTAFFVKGLILGDKDEFPNQFKADIEKAGISHILAVSGLHVSYLVSLCFVAFGKKNGNFVAIFVIIFFLLVVGFSPSILRASIMSIIMIIANLFSEKYDSKRAILIALIAILAFNPYAVLDVGFVLSFASCMGINYLFAPLNKKIFFKNSILNNFLAKPLCISLAVTATTTIPLVIYFESISSVSLLSNIFILPIISVLFPVIILILIIGAINTGVAKILAFIPEILIDITKEIIEFIASFKFSVIHSSEIIILATLVFFAFLLLGIFKEKLFKIFVPLSIISYYSVLVFLGISDYNSIITTVFSVSDGEAILVTHKDEVTLINCGSNSYYSAADTVTDYLYEYGYDEIDYLIITSIDKSHIRDINGLDVNVLNTKFPEKPVNSDSLAILEEFLDDKKPNISNELPSYIDVITFDEKKIAVKINENTITLHAFTNNMIDEFLEESDIKADRVILAEKVLGEYERLETALLNLDAKEVILSNDYENLRKVSGVNARSTVEYGTIRIKE